jgi:hypothetical protein
MGRVQTNTICCPGAAGNLTGMAHLEQPWNNPAQPRLSFWTARHRERAAAVITEAEQATPRWYRPAFLVMLAAVAVLYLWDLSASGYANSFYSAAVQAGTESWKACAGPSAGRPPARPRRRPGLSRARRWR